MKNAYLTIALCASLIAGGCQKSDQTTSAATPSISGGASSASANSISPEDLGKLGAKINKHPTEAAKLLSEQGLTESSFESAIRKVSSDPAASKRYAAAYKSAI